MKKFILICMLLLPIIVLATDPNKVAKHHPKDIATCDDCHMSADRNKINDEGCIGCHGDMVDGESVKFLDHKGIEHDQNPHDSHESPISCIKCHGIHKKSVLFCNGCHDFKLDVP